MDYQNQRVYPMNSDIDLTIHDGTPDPPKYVMLSEKGGSLPPPPCRRNIPRYHSPAPKKRGGSCFKCLFCFSCFFLILILILVSISFLLYGLYNPKIPTYNVQGLDVGAFEVQPDLSLYTEFIINVKAENPNEKIGITYGKDSAVSVIYSDSTLCSGKLPAFHQGQKNTTLMKVVLRGKSEYGSGLQEAFNENQRTGRIPLLIMVRVPKILIFRDIIDLPPCSGSDPIKELLMKMTNDLLKLYPGVVPSIPLSDIDDITIQKVFHLFRKAI
ncbi:hypothetical protein NE237_032568 [Protea cynaroides]|uniref:Late embryogenesis abundant protein LEA-2 subgroup domain-containing protein n=1 Tax=Protea cynaroides TaxID=273540 RepID=A0A9Q0L3Q9_9MAGN|nr:hypothetical protein NE237_032568 [Protea cynaroides]